MGPEPQLVMPSNLLPFPTSMDKIHRVAVVLAYMCGLYGSSKLTEVLVQSFPRCPSGLLIAFLFVLILVVMMTVQNLVFILQFVVCGPTCIVF